jgi:hypothetical protein
LEPLSGIKTGFNNAFLVDTETKERLLAGNRGCGRLIKPYLRGQDFRRWSADWAGLWMIVLRSSENYHWPWSEANLDAENVFRRTFPTVHAHLQQFRDALTKRQDQGRYWWELRSCAYWDDFDKPKIMYPEITWRSQWAIDKGGTFCNNTAYILPSHDPWILAAANAPISWWFAWRSAVHGKDEALRFIKEFVRDFPIPTPTEEQARTADDLVGRLAAASSEQQATRRAVLDCLRLQYGVEKPSLKLQSPTDLNSDAFVVEVAKALGKKKAPTTAALKALRDEYTRLIAPARKLAADAMKLESELSDLVNQAYGLTPDEVALMWQTAPPRMPITGPE